MGIYINNRSVDQIYTNNRAVAYVYINGQQVWPSDELGLFNGHWADEFFWDDNSYWID